ncbi:MAG: superinfection immunity protein [Acidimicrobiales bacterium]
MVGDRATHEQVGRIYRLDTQRARRRTSSARTAAVAAGCNWPYAGLHADLRPSCDPVFAPAVRSLYMLPTIIESARKVVYIASVFAINLLLGWTLVGWVVALPRR